MKQSETNFRQQFVNRSIRSKNESTKNSLYTKITEVFFGNYSLPMFTTMKNTLVNYEEYMGLSMIFTEEYIGNDSLPMHSS